MIGMQNVDMVRFMGLSESDMETSSVVARLRKPAHNRLDMTGEKFSRLAVLGSAGARGRLAYWRCRCDCGKSVEVAGACLRSGNTKSCGCLKAELARKAKSYLEPGRASLNATIGSYVKRARLRGRAYKLGLDVARELFTGNCHYCGIAPSSLCVASTNGSFMYNGIDRVDNAMGYVEGNCVSCCFTCNSAKRGMGKEEFESWVLRAAKHIQARSAK